MFQSQEYLASELVEGCRIELSCFRGSAYEELWGIGMDTAAAATMLLSKLLVEVLCLDLHLNNTAWVGGWVGGRLWLWVVVIGGDRCT